MKIFKRASYKHLLQSNKELVNILCEENLNKSIVDFCQKQRKLNRLIFSVEEISPTQTYIICGDVSLFTGMVFTLHLFLVDGSENPMRLALLNATLASHNIYIDDLQVNFINKGYGGYLLSYFIKFCNYQRIEQIKGSLMPTDIKSHKERLYHFYKKHGFSITDTNDEFTKIIEYNNSNANIDLQ